MAEANRDHPPAGPKRRRYQQDPVLLHLPKLYPPDGKVPDRVPTETVRQRVLAELAHENEELIQGVYRQCPARAGKRSTARSGATSNTARRARPYPQNPHCGIGGS